MTNHIKTIVEIMQQFEEVHEYFNQKVREFQLQLENLKDAMTEQVTVDEVIIFEGMQYKRVDREAQEGDVVVLGKGVLPSNAVKAGEIHRVVLDNWGDTCLSRGDKANVYETQYNRTTETVAVYEQVPYEAIQQRAVAELTANELRAEIIEEAKRILNGVFVTQPKFVVNVEKRTIVALIPDHYNPKVIIARGIAKCHPDDVFNEDIGKVIALHRALNMETSKFENAVQPTERVYGMCIERRNERRKITKGLISGMVCNLNSKAAKNGKIIDDTDAQYE